MTYDHVVEKYNLLEVEFDLSNGYVNPYDPFDIEVTGYFTSPSGVVFMLPGFYYQDVHKENEPSGGSWDFEKLTLETTYNWRLRFTPNEEGSWKFYIAVTHNDVITESSLYKFECSTSSNKGFIRRADSKYLKYDDGSQYYPVGINLPHFSRDSWWGEKEYGTNQILDYIDKMKISNINHFRFEINMFQGLNLYGPDLTDNRKNFYKYFNQKDAWQLDEIVSNAANNSITLSLAINSWQDFDSGCNFCNSAWVDYNPYNQNITNNDFFNSLDGPGNCETVWDFFNENTEALQVQKNLMRYIIARWGYATNVSAFIVFDEANQIDVHSNNPPDALLWVQDWHIPIIDYIKETDPYNHLINSGNAGSSFFTEHEAVNLFDFYQGHRYTDMTIFPNNSVNFDKLLFNEVTNNLYESTFMPVLFGEFTYMGHEDMEVYDPNAYGVHSILWSSLFSGSFGTPMYWEFNRFWYNFPAGFDRYIGVGNYSKTMPQLKDNLTPQWEENNDFRVCYLYNNNSTKFYGWVQDMNFRFANILNNYPDYLIDFEDETLLRNTSRIFTLNVSKPGEYYVRWYNTLTGEEFDPENTTTVVANSNLQIEIELPEDLHEGFFADGAFIIQLACDEQWNNSLLTRLSPQYPPTLRSNSSIVTDNFGQPLFVGSDNKVHIMWFNGTYFQDCKLNNLAAEVRINSGLAIDQTNRIYYISKNNNMINRLYWDYTTNHWEEETISVSSSDPVRFGSNISVVNNLSVFYISSLDNKAHVLWLDDGIYRDAVVLSRADEIDKNSLLSVDNNADLYYMGANDKKMHKLFWSWETKQWEELIIDQNHLTDIRPFSPVKINSINSRIYYFSNDNKIHEKRIENNYYVDATIAHEVNYIVQANSDLEFDSNNELYFISEKLIHKTYWDNFIGDWVIEELGTDFPENTEEYLCINNYDHIFYKNSDLSISVDYFGCDDNYKNISSNGVNEAYKFDGPTKSGSKLNSNSVTNTIKSINIYPNPAKESINISFTNYNGEISISLLSAQGAQITKAVSFINEITIDTSNIPPGIYILRIENEGVCKYRKVIIK